MSTLLSRLQTDLNAARKTQDAPRTLVLGTLLADAKNRGIELRRDLTDEDVVEVLRRGVKRRRESIDAYRKATHQAELDEGYDEEEAEFVPAVLPDQWRDRIRAEFPEPTAEALILIFEGQYTRQEAADEVGITKMTLSRAFATLRTWKGDI